MFKTIIYEAMGIILCHRYDQKYWGTLAGLSPKDHGRCCGTDTPFQGSLQEGSLETQNRIGLNISKIQLYGLV